MPMSYEWRPIATAPRDGSYILAEVAPLDGPYAHLAGRFFVIRHEGTTASGFDLGWAVYPGFGGASDRWFSRWTSLPPTHSAATLSRDGAARVPPPVSPGGNNHSADCASGVV